MKRKKAKKRKNPNKFNNVGGFNIVFNNITPSNSRSVSSISNNISLNAVLAAALQVAAHDKPGNVHRYHDFKTTKLEHYLSSAISLNNPMYELGKRGILIERGLIDEDEVDMGWIISEAMKEGVYWHFGGITNLGMLFLYSPIALAAGYLLSRKEESEPINMNELPKLSLKFVANTTPEDTVNIFSMLFNLKSETYPLSTTLGISLPESINELLEGEINLLDFYKLNKSKNLLFEEISSGYPLCFGYGISAFLEAINNDALMVDAITHTYITLLSLNPDSRIHRKFGNNEAIKIMNRAKEIMDVGGYLTQTGKKLTKELDQYLSRPEKPINPGITADLTANVTFLATLGGIRP